MDGALRNGQSFAPVSVALNLQMLQGLLCAQVQPVNGTDQLCWKDCMTEFFV